MNDAPMFREWLLESQAELFAGWLATENRQEAEALRAELDEVNALLEGCERTHDEMEIPF